MQLPFGLVFNQHKLLSLRVLKALGQFSSVVGITILLLLFPPGPEFVRRVYTSGFELSLFLAVIFSVLLSRRGSFWSWFSLACTLSLFTLSLIYKWQTLNNDFLIGGFLPWSDSAGYYYQAQRLLYGFSLTPWGARRPLFPAFLAVALAITGNNFRMVLIMLVLLNALAVYLATREVQAGLQSAAGAAAYLVVSFLFYRRFAGTVLTENLGFLFGNLALVFLLQGAREYEFKKLYWGLFLLTIGLNVRAGTFFVLPVLAIWITHFLRQRFVWWRVFAGVTLVVLLGMILNMILLKLIGPSEGGIPFLNYFESFYGLASGNTGWNQVYRDHPNANLEDVPALAIQKFREDPSLLIVGIEKSYQDYFTTNHYFTTYRGAFSFILFYLSRKDQRDFAGLALWGLTAVGLIFAVAEGRRNKDWSIALAGFLGILLSVSLVPPRDSNLMRVYATTIPITAFVISLGVAAPGALLRNRMKSFEASSQPSSAISSFSLPVSIALLMALFFGALLVKQFGRLPDIRDRVACSPGYERVLFLLGRGSSMTLVSDEMVKESYIPYVRISDFKRQAATYGPELGDALLSLNPGIVLILGERINDMAHAENLQTAFVASTDRLEPGYHELCVARSDSQLLKTFPSYYHDPESVPGGQSINLPDRNIINRIRSYYVAGLWISFFLLILDLVRIWQYPLKAVPFVFANTLAMSVGVVIWLHCLGLVPVQWERIPLNLERAQHIRGYLYAIDLGTSWMSNTGIWDYPVKLYEDGAELSYPDQKLRNIASEGGGSFTVLDGYLYFSSSDHTDPLNNGREYQLVWPAPIRQRYQWFFYLLTILCLFVHARYIKRLLPLTNVSPDTLPPLFAGIWSKLGQIWSSKTNHRRP